MNGIAIDSGNTVYIGDVAAGPVRTVTSEDIIHTTAGAGPDRSNAGFAGDGGMPLSAQFNGPAPWPSIVPARSMCWTGRTNGFAY